MTEPLVCDPVFRTRYRFTRPGEGGDDAVPVQHVEMWVDPGGGVPAHVHPAMEERFEVLAGHLELLAGRRWSPAHPGEIVVIPAGTRHAFRNRGGEVVHARCRAQPPSTLQAFLEDAAGLSRAGKLTRIGLPRPGGLLEAAVMARDYQDMVILGFPSPPLFLQRLLLFPLARLGDRRGLRAGSFADLGPR